MATDNFNSFTGWTFAYSDKQSASTSEGVLTIVNGTIIYKDSAATSASQYSEILGKNAGNNTEIGIVINCTDLDCYYFAIDGSSSGQWSVQKRVNDEWSWISSGWTYDPLCSDGLNHTFRIERNGAILTAKIDNTTVGTFEDTGTLLTGGQPGILGWNGTAESWAGGDFTLNYPDTGILKIWSGQNWITLSSASTSASSIITQSFSVTFTNEDTTQLVTIYKTGITGTSVIFGTMEGEDAAILDMRVTPITKGTDTCDIIVIAPNGATGTFSGYISIM